MYLFCWIFTLKNNNAMSQIEPILQENKNLLFFQSNTMIFGNGTRKWRLVFDCRRNWLSQDLNDWNNKLNEEEKYFIKHILAFFCCFWRNRKRKLAENFVNEVQYAEAKFFYGFQSWWKTFIAKPIHYLSILTLRMRLKDELFNALEVFLLSRKKTGL
jgi:ribonucleoside-diphosphate reductase beta chain